MLKAFNPKNVLENVKLRCWTEVLFKWDLIVKCDQNNSQICADKKPLSLSWIGKCAAASDNYLHVKRSYIERPSDRIYMNKTQMSPASLSTKLNVLQERNVCFLEI